MNNLCKKFIIAVAAIITSGTVVARPVYTDWFDCFFPFVGLDFYQAWMQPKGDWGKFLPKNFPGGTLYVGAKFQQYFGFELGYDCSVRKPKNWSYQMGELFFNTRAIANNNGGTRVRRSGAHVDLMGFIPLRDCIDLLGTLGLGWVQPKIDISQAANSLGPVSSPLASLSAKARGVVRVGGGATYMISDLIGVRAKLGWESTRFLRVRGNNLFYANGFSKKPFRNSATLAVGGFVRF
jgi:hypothetical protein